MLKKRGLNEVLFLEWDFGNRDFGPIANRVKDAKPDFVWVGAIGLDGNLLLDAMKKIDYVPPQHFYLYPAPGPLVTLPEAKNALSVTIFEEQPPFTQQPGAAEFVKLYKRARHQGRPARHRRSRRRPRRRTPPGRSSRPASTATKSLDDKAIARLAQGQPGRHHPGQAALRRPGNYGDDLMRIKQVQDGKWVVVWPKEVTRRRREAARQLTRRARMSGFTLPSATLLAQCILSGIFVGALYGLLGLGLEPDAGACCG